MTTSAIPTVYYAIFAIYEPMLCIVGFIGTFLYPEKAHQSQAPWPPGTSPGPSDLLSPATLVTLLQLAHCCALLGVVNVFVLTTAKHVPQLQLQEKIAKALLTPLLFGDVMHLLITMYALGEFRWHFAEWTQMLSFTFITGLTLFIPRVCWHLGLGRYKASRANRKAA